ncbi:MAG: hypothetical protein ACRCZF_19515, partial [Gemmataceae bacterium]
MPEQSPFAELLARLQQAPVRKRGEWLRRLIEKSQNSPDLLGLFRKLCEEPFGPTTALEFIARSSAPIPGGLVMFAAPLLPETSVPLSIRLSAAAKMIASLPDEPKTLRPLLRSLTKGLSRTKALDRMVQLQSRVEDSPALDGILKRIEKKVRYRCSQCGTRHTRSSLGRHLWKKHGI